VGRVSVNATPACPTVLAAGLVIVNVSDVVAFRLIADGLNAFAMEGGATTVMLAEAAKPVPPSVEVTALVELFCTPAAVPVTLTENVHELFAAIVPAERLITFVFCVAVIVPLPHEPVSPFGVEMIRPAGKVSLNPTPLKAIVVLPF